MISTKILVNEIIREIEKIIKDSNYVNTFSVAEKHKTSIVIEAILNVLIKKGLIH